MSVPSASRLGVKRQCLACGAKFYDFNRAPPTCPKCKHELVLAPVAEPAPPAEAPRAQRAPSVAGGWTHEQSSALGAVGTWLKAFTWS